jgi:hypothetical protein
MRRLAISLVGVWAVALSACRTVSPVLPPPCEKPAPLLGSPHRESPGVLVGVRRDHPNPEVAAAQIAERNNLGKINFLPVGRLFFIEDESPPLLAKLRCDADVGFLEYNEPVVLANLTSPPGT